MANRDAAGSAISDDVGKLILRLVLGLLILLHGVAKITGGVGSIGGMLTQAGLPASLSYLVYVGEVLAPILLIAGAWSRLAGLVVAANMVVAVLLVHVDHFYSLGSSGGWVLELQAMFLFTGLAIAFLGAGRYSLGGVRGRWN
ncbi:MAG: DoxX family protein [Caldimonas sp.]